MDAFEIVRRRALDLRRRVSLGAEASGLDIARALALAEGYDPIPLVPEDPLLQGAEAVLDRGIEAIFYRGSAEAPEAAALIAHELGHLVLHDGLSLCHAQDVAELESDPSSETTSSETTKKTGSEETRSEDGEAAELGGAIHRLDSYGARERQELQANVFARELLLPRPTARRLFFDGHGARQIAETLEIPLEMVRRQLYDALLLPPAAESESDDPEAEHASDASARTGRNALPLDEFQRSAAEHLGTPLLLEAGPGTGKTRTLVARILFLMDQGVDPASILALTFSNKAAQEIVERVSRYGGDATPSLFAGTFHAFGLEILRKHHDRVGLSPDLRVVDRADAIALLEEKLPTLGLEHHQNLFEPALALKEILAAVSRAKDELVDAAGYTALVRAMADRAEGEEETLQAQRALEVARVYEIYERTLRQRGWVDFGDLVMIPALLLEAEAGVRATLRLRYRHLLVDEYQDVNRAGARLLQALAGDGERLWVVGDSRQSIYRFRGASSANMRLFADDFPRARRKALGVGYRSTTEIVRTFTSFARTMSASEGMLPLELDARRGEAGPGGEPLLIEAPDPDGEVSAVAEQITRLAAEGVPLRDQGVLCRSNAQVERFAAGLSAHGLPVLHLGSLFERSEVRDLLSFLSLVVDPRGGSLARLAAVPEYAVPAEDVRKVLDTAAGRPPWDEPGETEAGAADGEDEDDRDRRPARFVALSLVRALAELPDEPDRAPIPPEVTEALRSSLSPEGLDGLARLAHDLEGASRRQTPWELLASYLLDRSSILRRDPEPTLDGRMRAVAVHQFLGFVQGARPGGRGFPAKRLLDRIRRLVLLGEERDLRQMPVAALHLDAVPLMTLHGSKGLEFEAVHLPSLYKGGFPSSFRRPRCPAPPGLITEFVEREMSGKDHGDGGGDDGESTEIERALHDAEEECLFFVAVSRARSRLAFYRPKTLGGRRRNPSDFLSALRPPPRVLEASVAAGIPTAGADGFIPLRRGEGINPVRGRDLSLYERCPRRFFYSRVFGLPGDRRESAYQETHGCLYEVLGWMKEGPRAVDDASVRERMDELWKRSGPTGHAFEAEYRELLESLVARLLEARQDLSPPEGDAEEIRRLVLELDGHDVHLEADLAGRSPADVPVLRLVRTGRGRSFRAEDTVHALWQQAGLQRFGPGSRVEVVHLADGSRTPVELTARKLATRLDKGRALVKDLSDGRFPARRDPVACPRCPYFFVCPTVPGGPLTPRPVEGERPTAEKRVPAERSEPPPADPAIGKPAEKEKSLPSRLPVSARESD